MAEPNLVWKDTVLVRTGQVVDILFDVSNPGLWMAHCHIAEHMQSGMMFSFNVARARPVSRWQGAPSRPSVSRMVSMQHRMVEGGRNVLRRPPGSPA